MKPLNFPRDRNDVEKLLSLDPYLNLYSIGDLDERFLPYTEWYGRRKSGSLTSVICIYTSTDAPTLMALSEQSADMAELLKQLIPILPEYFQAHLSPGLKQLFDGTHTTELDAPHYKMALLDTSLLNSTDTMGAVRLRDEDIPMLSELYEHSYPGNWFEPDMLELNRYFGIKDCGRLIAAAGTHVYSPEFKAAALGNITTRPEYRGQGFGSAVTAGLSRFLLSEGMRVGLNVKIVNHNAVSVYKKLGFSIRANFGEFVFRQS